MLNRKTIALVVLLTVAALLLISSATAQIPEKFTNLKVVPKDIGQRDLINVMKDFTFALGTRCWYCHEGEGDDLSTFDFASDAKPAKEVSRRHYEMTQMINEKFFAASETKVECMTCHQGEAKPSAD